MNLRDYLRVLRKRWKLIVSTFLVCVVAGLAFVYTSEKRYEATAQIFVSTAGVDTSTAASLAQGNTFTQARVQSYTSIATSPRVTQAVVDQLGLDISASQLASQITADAPPNKVLINLHVSDRSAAQAALLANAVAEVFSTQVEAIEQTAGSAVSPVKLTVIQPARIPGAPSSPRVKLDIALAMLVGAVLGLGLALVREVLDNTVKSSDELVEETTLPVFGVIAWDKLAPDKPISFRADLHGTRAESFRQLRTNLEFVDVDNPPRTIAVTSAMPGEGKSHTALNLAAALAEAGKRVCLVEADLRKPTVAWALGLVGDVGLTSVLIGQAEVEEVLQSAGPNFAVLAAGPVPPNPSELLLSANFKRVLATIAEHVDVVIIDTAPLLPVADGAQIASMVDATLLAVRAGKTTREQISRALGTLTNVGVTPVGTVLSMASNARSGAYGYYYYGEYRPVRPGHARARGEDSDLVKVDQ